ncbi:MAG: hypothetical protein J6Q42_04765 [Clostridia bacterium]|jgi:hypothetical protein|nr:hypothetical protein [Clostridia bacterium]
MDDELGKKLNDFLSSPDSMEKIQGAMAALGISPDALPTQTPPPSEDGLGDLSGLLKLAPILSQLGQEDQNTTLLKALRPYLHGDREKRLEDSMKMMKLLKLLPLLKQKGGLNL